VIDVSTTLDDIERRLVAKKVSRNGFLASARISPSTWWRWKNGVSPNVSTLDRVLLAAKLLE
jgi:hypothetical protein